MEDYRLQIELTDETKREIALESEKLALEFNIRQQKDKIKKLARGFFDSLSYLVLFYALINFLWQYPVGIIFFSMFGILNLLHLFWLLAGLRKKQRTLERWKETVSQSGEFSQSR
jgi:hypothetical protein